MLFGDGGALDGHLSDSAYKWIPYFLETLTPANFSTTNPGGDHDCVGAYFSTMLGGDDASNEQLSSPPHPVVVIPAARQQSSSVKIRRQRNREKTPHSLRKRRLAPKPSGEESEARKDYLKDLKFAPKRAHSRISPRKFPRRDPCTACSFCNSRKIACGRPPVGSADPTCK